MMDILTPQNIAEKLEKSTRWVYQNALQLGGVKIGGSWFFTGEGLKNAVQGREKMAGEGHVSGSKVHSIATNQISCKRMGGKKNKESEKYRQEAASRHGFSNLLR